MRKMMTILLLITFPLLLVSCSRSDNGNALSQKEVFSLVEDNEAPILEAAQEIREMDPIPYFLFSSEKFRPNDFPESEPEGLYAGFEQKGQTVYERIKSDRLAQVMSLEGVREIYIEEGMAHVEFSCGWMPSNSPPSNFFGIYYIGRLEDAFWYTQEEWVEQEDGTV